MRARLDEIATQVEAVGEVRGLGAMLGLELVADAQSRAPAPELTAATLAAARERGLLALACGLYANVIRLLPPLTIDDAGLDRGLDILEEALLEAAGTGRSAT
jgi:4-aminobutyrate aminotransferase-like enzyme